MTLVRPKAFIEGLPSAKNFIATLGEYVWNAANWGGSAKVLLLILTIP